MCDKISYNSKDEAKSAIVSLVKKHNQSFDSYHCDECGKFHVTSIKKKRLSPDRGGNKYKTDYSNDINRASEKFDEQQKRKKHDGLKSKSPKPKKEKKAPPQRTKLTKKDYKEMEKNKQKV